MSGSHEFDWPISGSGAGDSARKRIALFGSALFFLLGACSKPAGHPEKAAARQPTASEKSWDQVIAFEDPKSCYMAPTLQRLMDSLITITKDERLTPGQPIVPADLANAIGKLQWRLVDHAGGSPIREAYLPASGTWHGIEIVGFRRQLVPSSDLDGTSIFFRAPAEKVRSEFNKIGLEIPKSGYRETKADLSTAIGIQSHNDLSELYCNT